MRFRSFHCSRQPLGLRAFRLGRQNLSCLLSCTRFGVMAAWLSEHTAGRTSNICLLLGLARLRRPRIGHPLDRWGAHGLAFGLLRRLASFTCTCGAIARCWPPHLLQDLLCLAHLGYLELPHRLLLGFSCLILFLLESPLLLEHRALLILQEVAEVSPFRGAARVASSCVAVRLRLERELLELSFFLEPLLPLSLLSPRDRSPLVFHLPGGEVLLRACRCTLTQLTSAVAWL